MPNDGDQAIRDDRLHHHYAETCRLHHRASRSRDRSQESSPHHGLNAAATLGAVSDVDGSSLLESIPDAVVVADMQSTIVYANAAVEGLLGWNPGELIGQPLHAIQPERLHEAHDAGFSRYATTGTRTLFGTPVRVPARRSDGSEVDIELNLSEVEEASGRRLAVGVLRDLTERVELERQLSILSYLRATTAATARLRSGLDPLLVLQTLTDVLVQDFDAALARTWIYEPVANMLRLSTSGGLSTRVEGSSREAIDVATHPYKVGDVARTRKAFIRNGLRGDADFDQEWVVAEGLESVVCHPLVSGPDLLGVMVAFFRRPVFDEVAETIGHLALLASAAVRDANLVAQERDARAQADRARRHFEILARVGENLSASLDEEVTVQGVADTVVRDFADWCVIDLVSDAGEMQMIASAHRDDSKAALISVLRSRYPPAERAKAPHPIHRAMDASDPVWETVSDEDLRRRAVDEQHLMLLRELGIGSHIVVPLAGRGRVVGAISFIRGTDAVPFDADDVATAEDIARGTALATDNARLYRSAQEAVEVRNRFLAVASHELRTPLSVVDGHWQLLVRRLQRIPGIPSHERERIDTSLRRLGQGIDQLRRLVEDLLDVHRLSGEAMELRRTQLDLSVLLQDVVAGLHDASSRKRVQLKLPESPVVGTWDADRLTQVIGNLVGNALKYSPGSETVDISLRQDALHARLAITDCGIGIAADQLDAIFEPFSRAHNASAQHFPGLGLGLAVSREFVVQMGGRVWAESPGEGAGSTFIVELPLNSDPEHTK